MNSEWVNGTGDVASTERRCTIARTVKQSIGTAATSGAAPFQLSEVELTPERMREALRDEGERFVAAARAAPVHARVVGASGRTAGQTVQHLVDLCGDVLERLGRSRGGTQPGAAPGMGELTEFTESLVTRLADLLGEFGTRSPWETCATWWPGERTVRFWLRRTLHATTVQRVDMQSAGGVAAAPVPEDVAEDGVAEALRVWCGYRLAKLGAHGAGSAVEVRTPRQRWLVRADQQHVIVREIRWEQPGPMAAASVSGAAGLVYLWLWGRVPDRTVRITGDMQAAAQLWGLLRVATVGA